MTKGKFKKVVLKEDVWKVYKSVSSTCNIPIANILEQISLCLLKALNDLDYANYNRFFFASHYEPSKRMVLLKIFEMVFGANATEKEIEQVEKRIERAVKSRREKGVLA